MRGLGSALLVIGCGGGASGGDPSGEPPTACEVGDAELAAIAAPGAACAQGL